MSEKILDITRCLTISLHHISDETYELLKTEPTTNKFGLSVYRKADFGFWVYVPDELEEYFDGGKNIPEDLWNCMLLAEEHFCNWLCLDDMGPEVEGLTLYE